MSKPVVYRGKAFWTSTIGCDCLHCGGPIKYRPTTIGITESPDGQGIITRGYFCCWLCPRAYADSFNILSDEEERLTTQIMLDFRNSTDESDDLESYRFLQSFQRFSQIPSAPSRDNFIKYGGPLQYDQYRTSWSKMEPSNSEKFGDHMMDEEMVSSSSSSSVGAR